MPPLLGFLLGVAICLIIHVVHGIFPPLQPRDWAEEERVVSPDGKFEAVLIREGLDSTDAGPDWYLYLVEKGQRGHFETKDSLLQATGLKGPTLVWQGRRTVLFQYEYAEIQRFKNFWDAVDPPTTDPSGKAEDFIEVRLVAKSSAS